MAGFSLKDMMEFVDKIKGGRTVSPEPTGVTEEFTDKGTPEFYRWKEKK